MPSTYAGIGSRRTPQIVLTDMRKMATRLAGRGGLLSTSGVDAADAAFAEGARSRPEDGGVLWVGYDGRQWGAAEVERREALRFVVPEAAKRSRAYGLRIPEKNGRRFRTNWTHPTVEAIPMWSGQDTIECRISPFGGDRSTVSSRSWATESSACSRRAISSSCRGCPKTTR